MSNSLNIYLSGTVRKGKDDLTDMWTSEHKVTIERLLSPIKVYFLDPNEGSRDLHDAISTFGRDLFQISSSDVVFVDARDQRGIGVGAEMAFAKMQCIPVVTLCPAESHYWRKNVHINGQMMEQYKHPFLFSLSDFVAHSIEEATEWIKNTLFKGKAHIRGIDFFEDAMYQYVSTQFEKDIPMQTLSICDERLQQKVAELLQEDVSRETS